MKRNYLLILLLLCTVAMRAQERLLYSTNFQNWSALSASTTEQSVTKTTSFTNEALTFKLFQNEVAPTGWDATRFTNPPASPGYIRAAKVLSGATSYIITSPLKSITKVSFTHGATAGSRGYRLWKKSATDADWVAVTSATAYANPAAGQTVTATINDINVALKFTNLKETENAYLFDLNIYGNDAPALVGVVPADGSNTATRNGSIVVTFNEKVKTGTGNITLGSTVLTGSYGTKTATFNYQNLNYDTEYTFTIPAGALTDLSGNAFAGLTIKFRTGKRTEPVKKLFDAVVAQDGSGNYTTVTAAIAAAPTGRTTPWVIYIKNGTYTGHHDIPSNKPFIHLIGQSRDNVVISDSRLSGGPNAYHVSLGATMVVNSKDCYFENLTLENSVGYNNLTGPQALALYATTNHFATNNCWLRSYQDTYLTAYSTMSDRQYHKNTKIEGAVDYIYGGGDVFFDKCTLTNNRNDGGYIVAPSHATGTLWGYVFSNCTIDASPRIANTGSNYFGRPWHNGPKTVFINTTLKSKIKPAGWYYKMGAIPVIFADYNTLDANGVPVDLSQRISYYEYDVKDANGNVTGTVSGTAKNFLTDAEAVAYTYENVILRSSDTWDPRMLAEPPASPSNVNVNGTVISWNSAAYSRLYIIFRNNAVIGFTTNTTFTDGTAVIGQTYTYAVQAASETGALSSAVTAVNALQVMESSTADFGGKLSNTDPKGSDQNGLILYPSPASGQLQVIHPKAGTNSSITIYSLNGTRLLTLKPESYSSQSSVNVSGLISGTYILNYLGGGETFTSKFIKQ